VVQKTPFGDHGQPAIPRVASHEEGKSVRIAERRRGLTKKEYEHRGQVNWWLLWGPEKEDEEVASLSTRGSCSRGNQIRGA